MAKSGLFLIAQICLRAVGQAQRAHHEGPDVVGQGFRIGIGLCTGPVTSGNVGSARRLEYAAVGDTTNVAARLQEKNKDSARNS